MVTPPKSVFLLERLHTLMMGFILSSQLTAALEKNLPILYSVLNKIFSL